jgi:tetratricopeptide (TPR) repeat protein
MKLNGRCFGKVPIAALWLIAALFWTYCLPAFSDYDVPSFDDGMNKMSRRDYDGAIVEFNRAIGYNQRFDKAFFKRGQCFYYLQNFQLAADDFTAAINCQPEISEYYLWRGATYCKMGDDPHSVKDYVQALRMDPALLKAANGAPGKEETGLNSPMFEHRHKAGTVSGHAPRNEQSIANYKEALRIVNENIVTVFAPGTVFSGIIRPEFPADAQAPFLRPKGLDEIIANPKATFESCRKQLEINPRDPALHYRRALALQLMGKSQKALDDFSDSISPELNQAEVLLARACLYHFINDDASAQNDIARAHSVDPAVPALIQWSKK